MQRNSEVEELIILTNELRDMASSVLTRSPANSRGPKSKNQIYDAVDLLPHNVTRLRDYPEGRQTCRDTLQRFGSLFSDILADGLTVEQARKPADLQKIERLNKIQQHWRVTADEDANVEAKIRRVLQLCKNLLDQLPQNEPANDIASTKSSQTKSNLAWLARLPMSAKLAFILSISFVTLWAYFIPKVQIDTQVPPAANKYIMTEREALERLQVLWNNGLNFADKAEDDAYLESMSKAKDLALAVFGPESKPYAQALNHMIGALWTNGYHEESIAAARESHRIYTKLLGSNHPDVLNDQVNLGARLSGRPKLSEREEAKLLLFDALEKYQLLLKSIDVSFGMAHNTEAISIYYMDERQYQKAVEFSARSVGLIELANVQHRINRAWIIANHASVLERAGDCHAAKAMYQRAIAAYKRASIPITHKDHAYSIARHNQTCGG